MKDSYRNSNYSYGSTSEKKGVVTNTKRLNIRENPDLSAKVVTIASEGDVLIIDTEFKNPTFYKIKTETGVRGYCVKIYISM